MKRFEEGKTYAVRSICDADCLHSFAIIARTEKTVTTKVFGEVKKLRISVANGVESFKPHGSYSMAPTVTADKVAA